MAKTPQQIAAKWARNLQNSTQDIQDGVNAVTENPAEKAVAQQEKMLRNLTAAVQNGKWARGLQRVSLQDWKNAMLQKGIARIGQGATAGQSKMQSYMQEAMPVIQQLSDEVNQMPDLTIEDSINRAAFFIRGMKNFGDNR